MANSSGGMKKFRLGLQCFANVCTAAAVGLIMAAMFTSGWKVTYLDINFTSVYEHGLYRDCIKGQITGVMQLFSTYRSVNDYLCFWKFDQFNDQIQSGGVMSGTNRLLLVRDYQKTVFILLCVSSGLGLVTMICACTTCFQKFCNVVWAVAAILTSVVAVVGVVIFVQNAGINFNPVVGYRGFNDYDFYGGGGGLGLGAGRVGGGRFGGGRFGGVGGRGPYFGNNRFGAGAAGMDYYDDYGGGPLNRMNGAMLSGYYGNAWYGMSFYMCIAGVVVNALVCVLACVCTCLSFMEVKREREKVLITPNGSLYSIRRTHSTGSLASRRAVHLDNSNYLGKNVVHKEFDFDFDL